MELRLILGEPVTEQGQDITHSSMDSFLQSVEKQAFVMAMASCQNQDAALDIVQDSMFSMVKYYSGKPSEQWVPLFYKVLNNRITDHHRKRGFSRLTQWFGRSDKESDSQIDAVDQLDSNTIGPDRMLDASEIGAAMQSALVQLSAKQQQALMLRLWQGLSVKETAVAMSISEGSVKTHLSRAVHEMRELLKEFSPL